MTLAQAQHIIRDDDAAYIDILEAVMIVVDEGTVGDINRCFDLGGFAAEMAQTRMNEVLENIQNEKRNKNHNH